MTLRERLLSLLRADDFTPADDFGLCRRLGLRQQARATVRKEIESLLKTGVARRDSRGRLVPASKPARNAPSSTVATRAVFVPTRRGPTMPPPGSPGPFAAPAKPTPAAALPSAIAETPASMPKLKHGESVGRIQFRLGGSAYVVREGAAGEVGLQIAPDDTDVALPGDRVIVRELVGRRGRRPGEKVGRVVRVLERERDTIIGEFRRGRRHPVVLPDDPRVGREIHITGIELAEPGPAPREGDKVVVKLAEWTRRELPPAGAVVARLGRTFEPQAEMRAVLLRYNLSREFPSAAEQEASTLPDRVPAAQTTGREDFRRKAVFTIDPDDAKDFDDALSLEELPHGAVRVGVHIADVSAYVRPGTALDAEAQRRGNSTYLVGTVVPMLPEKLSNGLCSLVEAEDRLCKAVLFTFDARGALRETDFAETVIRSRKRLTYKQAYALLTEDDLERVRALPSPPRHRTGSSGRPLRELPLGELRDLQGWVRSLWAIAKRLRADRMAHGSLDLDMPETRILVDAHGHAEKLERVEHDESHQLVEEFMLAANEAVARLTRTRRLPSLYRVHDDPEPARLIELRETLAKFGIKTGDLSNRRELTRLLALLADHPQGHTLRTQLLRSLRKAAYRHTPDGHFGLHKRDYTHFTSPIRRYADLVVHRVLAAHLAKPGAPATAHDLPQVTRLGEHLTRTEVNSAEAERESVKVKLVEYFDRELGRTPPARFAAVITDVRPHGFFVELTESMTFGFVPAELLPADRYDFAEGEAVLTGRRHHRRYALNGRLDVTVARVDRYKRLIDFRPADDAAV